MADADSTASTVNNGVNVSALISAREALTNAPQAAQFKWRAACEWKNGTHSHSTVEGYYGLGQEQHHKRTFTFDADHPEVFASEDHGATPVEYVLVGLASCNPPTSSHGRSGGGLIKPQHKKLISNKNHNCNVSPSLRPATQSRDWRNPGVRPPAAATWRNLETRAGRRKKVEYRSDGQRSRQRV